jgi:hypothetical protein
LATLPKFPTNRRFFSRENRQSAVFLCAMWAGSESGTIQAR